GGAVLSAPRFADPNRRAGGPGGDGGAARGKDLAGPLQGAGEAQDRALVEARCRRDLAERHRRLVGMERVEHGERAFDRLDLVLTHSISPAFAVARRGIHTRTELRCTERCARQKAILPDRIQRERREWPDFWRERGCSI